MGVEVSPVEVAVLSPGVGVLTLEVLITSPGVSAVVLAAAAADQAPPSVPWATVDPEAVTGVGVPYPHAVAAVVAVVVVVSWLAALKAVVLRDVVQIWVVVPAVVESWTASVASSVACHYPPAAGAASPEEVPSPWVPEVASQVEVQRTWDPGAASSPDPAGAVCREGVQVGS